jgi:hypothetical protein
MSSFPPADWECRLIEDFDKFAPTPPAPGRLYLSVLMVIRPAAGREGQFRLALSGLDHVPVCAPINAVLPFEDLAGLNLTGQFVPGHQVETTQLQNFKL